MDQVSPLWIAVIGFLVLGIVVFFLMRKRGQFTEPAKAPYIPPYIPLDKIPPDASKEPPAVFIDRDDLMKWIGTSGFTHAVTLDGTTVHGGFGPALPYVSGEGTPDRNIKRS